MKTFIVACMCFAVALCAPAVEDGLVTAARRALPALEHEEIHDEFGQYMLRYITAEGTVVVERGRLVPNAEGTGYVLVTEGEVSYIGDDGKTYITKYSAGLDGYHVTGNHIPVAPEVPVVPDVPVVESLPVEAVAASV